MKNTKGKKEDLYKKLMDILDEIQETIKENMKCREEMRKKYPDLFINK